jgi:hypothetical protein
MQVLRRKRTWRAGERDALGECRRGWDAPHSTSTLARTGLELPGSGILLQAWYGEIIGRSRASVPYIFVAASGRSTGLHMTR